LEVTAFSLAQRYVGVLERPGPESHPLIQWWLSLCGFGLDAEDAIAWCSAFVNGIAWELRIPRTKSAAARSWLTIGHSVDLFNATAGFDVVVLKRGEGAQPGPEVINAPGHVGFFAGIEPGSDEGAVFVLGGNQKNSVSIARFKAADVLGVRRIA
jgi:uncharacterized protein (TIGR02594 family)